MARCIVAREQCGGSAQKLLIPDETNESLRVTKTALKWGLKVAASAPQREHAAASTSIEVRILTVPHAPLPPKKTSEKNKVIMI